MDSLNSLSRVLQIMMRLSNGEELTLQEMSAAYGKHPETIKKDISIIRNELAHRPEEIRYNRTKKSYQLIGSASGGQFVSALMLLMAMYGSRSLSADEVRKLEAFVVSPFSQLQRQRLKKYADSFRYHYKPILKKNIFELVETIFECIARQQTLRITYVTIYKETQRFEVFPYTMLFDEGYYYMIAEPRDVKRVEGQVFRIDQIVDYEVLPKPFEVDMDGSGYFKPGEFANYSFFMHSGEMKTVIRLRMRPFIESYFLAKFPVNQLIERSEDWLIYECTVSFEDSALFWIFSERHWVEVLSPLSLREKVKSTLLEMVELYKD